ncbi:MAG: hypothetical protein WBN55_07875 [Eudoraea sp.]|uniref:hypothetical protein n=1 Tax=Eudoraea sp. TaxID=1979955 RepID=UPI003C76BA18
MKHLQNCISLLVLIGILASHTTLSAQATVKSRHNFESTSQIMDIIESKLLEEKKIVYDMRDVIGSPYLTEEFVKGTLFLNEKNYGDYLFRYNIFRDEVEFKKDTYAPIESVKKIEGILIELDDNTKISVHTLTIDTNTYERKFLVELVEGNYQLNKLVRAKFTAPKKAETSLAADVKGKFTKIEEFYVINEDKVEKLVNRKKDLKKQFPDEGEKMMAFVNKEKINLKKEDDLKKLFQYINN